MRAVDIIQKKRDGFELTAEEIRFFIASYVSNDIPDYQTSALAMAVFFRGMTHNEIVALTDAMLRSGEILDLSELPAPKVDKHSTGGVGDKTSLIVAPLAAACGLYVPMISGRGLGHTGGTLDKLESIPGFSVRLTLATFRAVIAEHGLSFIGQTPEIAPADRRLYALRDVTATVESRPLISASIMSKKLAEGIDGLVLDVKTGDGAFLQSAAEAKELAATMLAIGQSMGKKVVALVTDMDQPLGRSVGNALEVSECIETLKGRGPKDLESLSIELTAWMLIVGERARSLEDARQRVRQALTSGAGLRKLRDIIQRQGGDPRVIDSATYLPTARETVAIKAEHDGRVTRIACRAIGHAAMLLGAGRQALDDKIDPAVGLVLHRKVGDLVIENEKLCTLYINDPANAKEAEAIVREAIQLGSDPPPLSPIVKEVLR